MTKRNENYQNRERAVSGGRNMETVKQSFMNWYTSERLRIKERKLVLQNKKRPLSWQEAAELKKLEVRAEQVLKTKAAVERRCSFMK